MAQTSLKSTGDLTISPSIASLKPRLPQTRSAHPDNNKAKEYDFTAEKEHDGFQPEQSDDSKKHIETAEEWWWPKGEIELYGRVDIDKGDKGREWED